jgi:hypothetical protein
MKIYYLFFAAIVISFNLSAQKKEHRKSPVISNKEEINSGSCNVSCWFGSCSKQCDDGNPVCGCAAGFAICYCSGTDKPQPVEQNQLVVPGNESDNSNKIKQLIELLNGFNTSFSKEAAVLAGKLFEHINSNNRTAYTEDLNLYVKAVNNLTSEQLAKVYGLFAKWEASKAAQKK